ncbi:hypothetical protein AC579_8744 [Pseudocercospora musae]|uniref:Glycosyltransferase family 15 protein n=1 Tax=Pseudocercospora musae TaxID=113226 RepID=A0A139IWI1_9PEZI|nr:hypothetical protein AC579_8744 [Pseudocercospora musae]
MNICPQRSALRALLLFTIASCIFQTYISLAWSSTDEITSESSRFGRIWETRAKDADHIIGKAPQDEPMSPKLAEQIVLQPSSRRERMNATFVSLVRNSELSGMLQSIRDIEDRFNRNWNYDWVFLNDEEFTEDFITTATAFTSGRAKFGKIDSEHWGFPSFINQTKAQETREQMADLTYGDSASYRHMCRYQSGFFYQHPLVLDYEWYWRVEPSIQLFCDIDYDPFRLMAENGKKYGFVISINELKKTVPSLWSHVKDFMKAYPRHVVEDNHVGFLSEDGGENWSYCHFWSNFEIASLDWYRSEAYNDFFGYLDKIGGFFYERWGDASVHTIAAALTLKKGEIHFFDDIGYRHAPILHCPRSAAKRLENKCICNPEENIAWNPSCTKRFFEAANLPFPDGHDRDVPREVGL